VFTLTTSVNGEQPTFVQALACHSNNIIQHDDRILVRAFKIAV